MHVVKLIKDGHKQIEKVDYWGIAAEKVSEAIVNDEVEVIVILKKALPADNYQICFTINQ